MAPEHLESFRTGQGAPGPTADLFSLGVILFQLLAGADPYPAVSQTQGRAHSFRE
jgi:serine/threonine protein kinase